MKILHVADTHLGYSAYRKATEDGINQRELDTYKAFEQFVTYAINTKPDFISMLAICLTQFARIIVQ